MKRFAGFLIALAAVNAAAQYDQMVGRELAKAHNIAPASDAAVADLESFLRQKAQKAEVAVEIAPAPAARIEPMLELRRLDVTGRAGFQDVQIFLAFASQVRWDRLADFESLQLAAQPEGRVAFRLRVAMVCWTDEPLRDLPATLKTIHALEERYQPLRIASALGDIERELRGKAIALTDLTLGADGRVSGALLGTAAREALVPALESSAFRIGHVDFTARGDCQAFTAPIELLPGKEPDKPSWAEGELFDDDTAGPCTPPKASAPRRVAAKGGGSVSMHLRGADGADVFRALNAATQESFLVDSSVAGRFDVDLDDATPEAAFAALRESGVRVGPGPLHMAGAALAVPAGDYKGEEIDIDLRDADLRDLTRLLGMIGKREFPAPPPGTVVSVFATAEPWDRLYAALQLVKPAAPAPETPLRRAWWRIDEIGRWSARELTLAGVVRTEKGWTAYAYTPGMLHRIFALTPSTKLRDASVAAVDATGVRLDNGTRLALP